MLLFLDGFLAPFSRMWRWMQESVCDHIAILYTLPQLKKSVILNPNTEAHFFWWKDNAMKLFKEISCKIFGIQGKESNIRLQQL